MTPDHSTLRSSFWPPYNREQSSVVTSSLPAISGSLLALADFDAGKRVQQGEDAFIQRRNPVACIACELGIDCEFDKVVASNPKSSAHRLFTVRRKRPAAAAASTLRAICTPTESRRNRSAPPELVTVCCLSAAIRLGRQNCNAGARLKMRLVASVMAKATSNSRRSILRGVRRHRPCSGPECGG